jgi:hypothetical protein
MNVIDELHGNRRARPPRTLHLRPEGRGFLRKIDKWLQAQGRLGRLIRILGAFVIWLGFIASASSGPGHGVLDPFFGAYSLIVDPIGTYQAHLKPLVSNWDPYPVFQFTGAYLVFFAITAFLVEIAWSRRNHIYYKGKEYGPVSTRYFKESFNIFWISLLVSFPIGAYMLTPGSFPGNLPSILLNLLDFSAGYQHYLHIVAAGSYGYAAVPTAYFYETIARPVLFNWIRNSIKDPKFGVDRKTAMGELIQPSMEERYAMQQAMLWWWLWRR